jgi:hypothetical protein
VAGKLKPQRDAFLFAGATATGARPKDRAVAARATTGHRTVTVSAGVVDDDDCFSIGFAGRKLWSLLVKAAGLPAR